MPHHPLSTLLPVLLLLLLPCTQRQQCLGNLAITGLDPRPAGCQAAIHLPCWHTLSGTLAAALHDSTCRGEL